MYYGMKITRKKAVLLSITVLLVLACVILGIILIVQKVRSDRKANEICILKHCLDGTEQHRELQTTFETICLQKNCISSNSPELGRICVFKKCVSEGKKENSSESICVSTKSCLNSTRKPESLIDGEVCLTETCVLAASDILKTLNQSVSPCEDFHEFSCGSVFRKNSPGTGSKVSTSKSSNNKISFRIKKILDRPILPEDPDALIKAKVIYRTCLISSETDSKSLEYLKHFMSSPKFGSFPSLNVNWTDCDLDFEGKMAILNAYGVDSLFKLVPEFKGINNTLYGNVYFAAPLVESICNENFEDEDGNLTFFAIQVTQRHRDLMTNVFQLLDASENKTESDIDDVLRFDAKFCEATKPSRERPPSYKASGKFLKDLIFIAPQINWSRWHYIIFNEIGLIHRLDKSHILAHNIHKSIKAVTSLIEDTAPRTIANYLSWKFVFYHLGFLKSPFRQLMLENRALFDKRLDFFMDVEPTTSRWNQCVRYVRKLMPVALIPPYFIEIADFELQKEMTDIISAVKKGFNNTFMNTPRLKSTEKGNVSEKIHHLKYRLFFSNKDQKFYDDYYGSIKDFGSSFLESGLILRKFHLKKLFEGVLLGKSIPDIEYSVTLNNPFDISDWSDFHENAISLSFAALENTGVNPYQPRYLNFGAFGTMIGQLMARGFSLEGVLPPSNWTAWTSEVVSLVEKRTRCFEYQFLENSARYSQKNLDFPVIVNNAIADNLGVQEVFKAYKSYVKAHGREKRFPGLKYSNEQLFFIKYAQLWCGIGYSDPETYTATKLRVNGAVRNTAAFSDIYYCRKGRPMNPAKKCKALWP